MEPRSRIGVRDDFISRIYADSGAIALRDSVIYALLGRRTSPGYCIAPQSKVIHENLR